VPSRDVTLASTSACVKVPEASQQSQQLQQPASAAVAQQINNRANSPAALTSYTATASQCSVELLSDQLQHATVHSTDKEQQYNNACGVSEATQHDVAVYALEFLLSDVMYELVNDVADSALLQRRNMLVNAADDMNGPLQAHLQHAAQQCGRYLSVQQTLQQLQHCIVSAVLARHSDDLAVVQHLNQQLEDIYIKNTGTLTDAQVLQVWSAAQREQGRAARAELAVATAVTVAVQQQQQQQQQEGSSSSGVHASSASATNLVYEASMLSQCSESALSDRRTCNCKQTDVASCTPPKQRRASRFSAVRSQYSVLMGNSSGSSRSSSSDSTDSRSSGSNSNRR
jgi:hypothetical protein